MENNIQILRPILQNGVQILQYDLILLEGGQNTSVGLLLVVTVSILGLVVLDAE